MAPARFQGGKMPELLAKICRWAVLMAFGAGVAYAAPRIDSKLLNAVNANPLVSTAVVITYDHTPTSTDLGALSLIGIKGGVVLKQLPMVLTTINQAQLRALSTRAGILSLYANRMLQPMTNVSRSFIGVMQLREDPDLLLANNGIPYFGNGIGVAVIDTGIDATHQDLQFGQTVRQNVSMPVVEASVLPNCPAAVGGDLGLALPGVDLDLGFAGPVYVENAPLSDLEGGHGTFVSGVIAGSGQASGDFYGGMAPGAGLVGVVAGNECGLPTFGILQAFDYVLVNQAKYHIRVANNSWGTTLASTPYDPLDPVNVATRNLHDRNIVVVFAAGNSGDNPGAINPYSTAPWVISVAAGEKRDLGTPASFSSRGEDDGTAPDVAGQPANPLATPNFRPDIIAPGADIKSTRSKGAGITNYAGTVPVFVGSDDLTTIPPAFLPFYTTSQGTSFAAPHVAGVAALMLEANPRLTPDDVVTILRSTATPMPYPERVVGAGYVDAHNAVRAALQLSAVSHPANLFPDASTPEIMGIPGDDLGTAAQDILYGDFSYDAATNQLVYTLTLQDLSTVTTNMRWTMSSDFGPTTVFVGLSITETGAQSFEYGTIAPDPTTGTRTQTSLGPPAAGQIQGNQITWRLGLDQINSAVGSDVLYTTSTNTTADSWLRIGSTLTRSLLLDSEHDTGRDYQVGTAPPPTPPTETMPASYCERFPGAVDASSGNTLVTVKIQNPNLDAKLNFNPGDQPLTFELVDSSGNVIAANASNGKRIRANGLVPGTYTYRLSGPLNKSVDYVVSSCQSQ